MMTLMKPGIKTTEMWQGTGLSVVLVALATGKLTEGLPSDAVQVACVAGVAILGSAYIISRAVFKGKASEDDDLPFHPYDTAPPLVSEPPPNRRSDVDRRFRERPPGQGS